MDQALAPPTATSFDAATSVLIATLYLAVGLAALLRAPRDRRVRVFLAAALLNVGPTAGTVIVWREGSSAAFTKPLVLLLAVTTLTGALTLFHFAQVFPWRRPWIECHLRWLVAGYVAIPALTAALILTAPSSIDEVTTAYLIVAAPLQLALALFAGAFIPLAGLVSIYKNYLDARARSLVNAQKTLLWMLISQAAGGVLAAIIIPLLRMVGMPAGWTAIASGLLFLFSLLMPLAYAMGVWRLGVLDTSDPEGLRYGGF